MNRLIDDEHCSNLYDETFEHGCGGIAVLQLLLYKHGVLIVCTPADLLAGLFAGVQT